MSVTSYSKKAKTLKLSAREIGRRTQISHVTVLRVLEGSKEGICSKSTREKIYEVIRAEAEQAANRKPKTKAV